MQGTVWRTGKCIHLTQGVVDLFASLFYLKKKKQPSKNPALQDRTSALGDGGTPAGMAGCRASQEPSRSRRQAGW